MLFRTCTSALITKDGQGDSSTKQDNSTDFHQTTHTVNMTVPAFKYHRVNILGQQLAPVAKCAMQMSH